MAVGSLSHFGAKTMTTKTEGVKPRHTEELPTSRKEAMKTGATHYRTVKSCKYGH